MATVNVNRNLADQFYRYKMPKLLAKVEGKGNGIKTVIVNMVDIAKALNRPPMYPTKYFGCVLGAQVNCDQKNERYIVNGSHDSAKLQDLLDGFIQKYVLCAGCGNPETVLGCYIKKGIITSSCKACGYSGTIPSQDKLATYIMKYPPTQKTIPTGPSLQPGGKKSKRKNKDGKDAQNGENGSNSPQNESDENEFNDKDEVDDDDWWEDTSEEAIAKRMQELSTGATVLMQNNDLEKSPEERLQIFFEAIKKKNEACAGVFDVAAQKDIVAEAERLEIRDKAVIALCELLFDDKMLNQIKQHRTLFLRFTNESPKAQKYLMRGMELSIKLFRKDLVPKVSHILKAFYEFDILDEQVILEWGSKKYKKTVGKEVAEEIHAKAAPFLKWLKEAEEEESDESDDEEENIEVVYDDRVIGTKIEEIKEKPSPAKALVKPSEDDLDIDAI